MTDKQEKEQQLTETVEDQVQVPEEGKSHNDPSVKKGHQLKYTV